MQVLIRSTVIDENIKDWLAFSCKRSSEQGFSSEGESRNSETVRLISAENEPCFLKTIYISQKTTCFVKLFLLIVDWDWFKWQDLALKVMLRNYLLDV